MEILKKEKEKEKDEKGKEEDDDDFEPVLEEAECVRLVIQSLLEVVESGSKNIEIAVVRRDTGIEMLPNEKVVEIVKSIEDEKEKTGKGKKKKGKQNEALYKASRESNQ